MFQQVDGCGEEAHYAHLKLLFQIIAFFLQCLRKFRSTFSVFKKDLFMCLLLILHVWNQRDHFWVKIWYKSAILGKNSPCSIIFQMYDMFEFGNELISQSTVQLHPVRRNLGTTLDKLHSILDSKHLGGICEYVDREFSRISQTRSDVEEHSPGET